MNIDCVIFQLIFKLKFQYSFTCQGGDLTVAEECAAKSVNLTADFAELPSAAAQEIERRLRDQSQHQAQIGNGQIDDQHVGRRSQRFVPAENLQDHNIASDSHRPCNQSSINQI